MTATPFVIRKIAFIELFLKTPHCSSGLYNQRVLVSNCFLFSLNSIFFLSEISAIEQFQKTKEYVSKLSYQSLLCLLP